MKIKSLALAITVLSINVGYSVTTNWTGGSGVDTTDWSDATNWSAGVPTITTVANLVYPAGDLEDILISSDSSALGLIYGADLTYYKFLTTSGGVTLTLGSSGITSNANGVGQAIEHAAATALGASSTFTAGTLGLVMSGAFDTKTYTLNVAASTGTLLLQGGTSFSVASASNYGNIAGTGAVQLSGALNFNFTTPVGVGTWDFISQTPTGTLTSVALGDSYTGAFTEATPGNWVATAGGLNWSYQASTGILTSVIPEPSTWALLACGLTTVIVFRRRKRA